MDFEVILKAMKFITPQNPLYGYDDIYKNTIYTINHVIDSHARNLANILQVKMPAINVERFIAGHGDANCCMWNGISISYVKLHGVKLEHYGTYGVFETFQEIMIYILAHEFKHWHQYQTGMLQVQYKNNTLEYIWREKENIPYYLSCECVDYYLQMANKGNYEPYLNIPWEKDANNFASHYIKNNIDTYSKNSYNYR